MNTNVGSTDLLRNGPPSLPLAPNNFQIAGPPFANSQPQPHIHLPNSAPNMAMMAAQSNSAMINQQGSHVARMVRPPIGHNPQPGLAQRQRTVSIPPGSQIPPGSAGHTGMSGVAGPNTIQAMGFNSPGMQAQNTRRINPQPHLQNQANMANMGGSNGAPGMMMNHMNSLAGMPASVRHPQPPQTIGMGLQSHVSPDMQVGLSRSQDPSLPQAIQRSTSAAMPGQMVNGIPASPSFQGTHNAGMPNSMHQNNFGMPHPSTSMSASPQPTAGHLQSHVSHGNGPHPQNPALSRPLSGDENMFSFQQPNNFPRRPGFNATASSPFIGGEHQEDHAANGLNNGPGFMSSQPQGTTHMRPAGEGHPNGPFLNMPPPPHQAMSRGPHDQHPNPHAQMTHRPAPPPLEAMNHNAPTRNHTPRPQSQPQNQPHLPAQPQPHPQPHPHPVQQPGRPPSQADARQTPRMPPQSTPNMNNIQPPARVPSAQPNGFPSQPATMPQGVPQQPQQGPNTSSGPAPGAAAMVQMLRGRMPLSPNQVYIPPGHIGPGQGIQKLLQLSAKLATMDKEKLKLSYWEELVRTFFTNTSELKLALFRDAQTSEVKSFCLNVAIMPRYFLVTSQAGVESMSLVLDGGRERYPESDHCVVECLRAAWTFKYSNGYIVTLRGPLTVHVKVYPVTAQPNAPGGPQAPTQIQQQLLIDQIQFDGETHEKHISVDSIAGLRIPDNSFIPRNPPSMPGETEKKWDEPRMLIERATIPTEPVSSFGVPQPTMRCLELAESVGQMADLIQFARINQMGALEGLTRMAAKIREHPLNLPNLSATRPGVTSSISAIGAPVSSPSMTLYSSPSGPPSTSTMQSAPTPSPKDMHATVPVQNSPPKPASAKPASAATPGSVAGTPTQVPAKVPGTSSTQNTPSMASAPLKRKAPDSSSGPAGNTDAPNKRGQRKRGKTASGGG